MRILFLTNAYPNPAEPTRGTYNLNTAHALAARHQVSVVSHIPWPNRWRFIRAGSNFPLTRMDGPIDVHHPTYWYPPGILREAYGTFLWQSVRGVVHDVLHRAKPDAVLSFWVHPDGEAARRAAAEAGVPSVVIAGGSDVLVLGQDARRRQSVSDTLSRSAGVICVSAHLKRAVEDLGIDATNVHVVHNGIDTARFSPGDRESSRARLGIDPRARMVLWVGRMVALKGLDVLLTAAAAVSRDLSGLKLCLVGDGPARAELEAQARHLGIAEHVRFAGNVTHDALAEWYRAANLTALPSYSEGSPNVLLESIACGTPFVASRVGGIPEFADPRLDRLVEPGDAGALGQALGELLAEARPPDAPRRLCTWDEHGAAVEAVLQSVIR